MYGPCENFLEDFYTSALLKAIRINLFCSKKAGGQPFRIVELQKSAREFSHGLDFNDCYKVKSDASA